MLSFRVVDPVPDLLSFGYKYREWSVKLIVAQQRGGRTIVLLSEDLLFPSC